MNLFVRSFVCFIPFCVNSRDCCACKSHGKENQQFHAVNSHVTVKVTEIGFKTDAKKKKQ